MRYVIQQEMDMQNETRRRFKIILGDDGGVVMIPDEIGPWILHLLPDGTKAYEHAPDHKAESLIRGFEYKKYEDH